MTNLERQLLLATARVLAQIVLWNKNVNQNSSRELQELANKVQIEATRNGQ